MPDDAKRDFLENEIMLLTLDAALATRATRIYRDGLNVNRKKVIRGAIKSELRKLAKGYADQAYSEEDHTANIQKISDNLSGRFGAELHNDRFRIGISQKLLNLYLKYLWTLDRIHEPYHCPFDSLIISKLKGLTSEQKRWTLLDKVEDYRALVEAARRAANESENDHLSVAGCELQIYQELRKQDPQR